jgi:RNA polymerase sigma-70 factor (ECF subfamily)
MSHLHLISSRPSVGQEDFGKQVDHPSLEGYQREFAYLIRTLRRLGVPRSDLEDVAQEVFIVLHHTWEKYDPARPLRAYIFGIAFRVSRNHARKGRREVPHAVMNVCDGALHPDQTLEAKQVRALVLRALDRVPLSRRAVLIMHDIDKLPMGEIASTLSIYRFTGYSRLRKARQEFAAAVGSLRGAGEA